MSASTLEREDPLPDSLPVNRRSPGGPGTRPAFAPGDAGKLALFLGGAALAMLPSRFWLAVSRRIAAMTATNASVRARIPAPMIRLIEAQGFEAGAVLRANHLVEAAQVMRHYTPWGWHPRIRIVGQEHLDEALAIGQGAVVWEGDFASRNLVTKIALSRYGYEVGHLSRTGHPYSMSRFGRAFLNRPQVAVETGYLHFGRLIVDEGQGALKQAHRLLAENKVVTVRAGPEASRIAKVPFLGGTLTIALGPPHMAATAGAPLLPLFSRQLSPDEYEVTIGPPLPPARGRDFAAPARAFAEALEVFVRAHPEQWQGWEAVELEGAPDAPRAVSEDAGGRGG